MNSRILAVGDIHLGRRPSRIPADLDPDGRLTPAAAWHACVAEAVAMEADVVLLAGDVVEQTDDLYEAYPDLAHGIDRLREHGIPVAGIAGNHDGEVLPRLAASIPHFRLLGAGNRWETAEIGGVEVAGWSFSSATAAENPLAGGLPSRRTSLPRIGLLHCDRDQTGSRYAPVRTAELHGADVDAWLLGHIHRPDPLAGPRPMGYLGSVMGLDPGEPGRRGPWRITVHGPGHIDVEHLPLAPLRWEPLEVDATGLEHPDDLHGRLLAALEACHHRLALEGAAAAAVGCRLRITGRTGLGAELEARMRATALREFHYEQDGTSYFIEAVRLRTQPAIDLEQLARGADPLGLVARRLLLLQRPAGDTERADLIRRARPALEQTAAQPTYWGANPAPLDDERVATILEEAARRALDALEAQRDRETAG